MVGYLMERPSRASGLYKLNQWAHKMLHAGSGLPLFREQPLSALSFWLPWVVLCGVVYTMSLCCNNQTSPFCSCTWQYTGLVFVYVFVRTSIRHQEDRDITERKKRGNENTCSTNKRENLYAAVRRRRREMDAGHDPLEYTSIIKKFTMLYAARDKCSLSLSFDLDA